MTGVAQQTHTKWGMQKGDHFKWVTGHHTREPGTLEERFWRRVQKAGPDECWEWQGSFVGRNRGQYGRFNLREDEGGAKKYALSHRLSWELHHGLQLRTEDFVCHSCDNPPCVNPAHLFIGTMDDNFRDMRQKDRHSKGMKQAASKLTDEQVRAIRAEYQPRTRGRGPRVLGRKYGVDPAVIERIIKGKAWTHVE